jgi:hypothetical protein
VFTSQIHNNKLEIDEKNLNSPLGLAGGGGLAGLTGGLGGDLTGGLSGMTIYMYMSIHKDMMYVHFCLNMNIYIYIYIYI